MKKLIFVAILLLIVGIGLYYKDIIIDNFSKLTIKEENTKLENFNEYYRDYDFMFVQNTDNFKPTNKQELLNVFYTIINSGVDKFTFYCSEEYTSCTDDIENIADDQTILSDINNYVHPFNSFKNVETEYDTKGKVTLKLYKAYTKDEIRQINQKVDILSGQLINESDSDYNNILRVHDYIVNNTIYDSDRSDNNIINYKSDIAYGPLFEGYAICGGYTDLMELFLEKMNIKSFRVSSNMHVWNAVYYNNNWVNLDLTWDDPILDDGTQMLDHNYFLITTPHLLSIETTEHTFDYNSYPELKGA